MPEVFWLLALIPIVVGIPIVVWPQHAMNLMNRFRRELQGDDSSDSVDGGFRWIGAIMILLGVLLVVFVRAHGQQGS